MLSGSSLEHIFVSRCFDDLKKVFLTRNKQNGVFPRACCTVVMFTKLFQACQLHSHTSAICNYLSFPELFLNIVLMDSKETT